MIVVGILIATQAATQSGVAGKSEVFQICKSLLGGTWEGTVGKDTRVEFRFHLEDEGNKFVGEGKIGAGSPRAITVRSSFGWDPEAKQVYYLDQHGYQTVYFGHVTRDGDTLVTDFRGLVGDSGHYLSRATIGKDDYLASMTYEKDGQWVDVGLHLHLHKSHSK